MSNDFKTVFQSQDTTFQLVPPLSHCRNLAERAIQTWKIYFKAGLATTDPKFPMSEWDRLIPLANITLNLLYTSRSNLSLSAYTYVYKKFSFTATSLAPLVTKIIAHLDPQSEAPGNLTVTKDGTWDQLLIIIVA